MNKSTLVFMNLEGDTWEYEPEISYKLPAPEMDHSSLYPVAVEVGAGKGKMYKVTYRRSDFPYHLNPSLLLIGETEDMTVWNNYALPTLRRVCPHLVSGGEEEEGDLDFDLLYLIKRYGEDITQLDKTRFWYGPSDSAYKESVYYWKQENGEYALAQGKSSYRDFGNLWYEARSGVVWQLSPNGYWWAPSEWRMENFTL